MIPAIVVGGVDVGDAHRIVRLLTPERGRISGMARNARGSRRRFVGVLELGTRLRVGLKAGRGDLELITETEGAVGLDRARGDLDRLALAAYGCEVVASLAPEDQPAHKLYTLLTVWLDVLELPGPPPGHASRLALEAKALTFAGLTPTLLRCASCGEGITDPAVFDPLSGGALHQHCGAGRQVSRHQLILLEALRRTPLEDTRAPHPVAPSVRWLLSDFVQHQIHRELKSRSMLEVL